MIGGLVRWGGRAELALRSLYPSSPGYLSFFERKSGGGTGEGGEWLELTKLGFGSV